MIPNIEKIKKDINNRLYPIIPSQDKLKFVYLIRQYQVCLNDLLFAKLVGVVNVVYQ